MWYLASVQYKFESMLSFCNSCSKLCDGCQKRLQDWHLFSKYKKNKGIGGTGGGPLINNYTDASLLHFIFTLLFQAGMIQIMHQMCSILSRSNRKKEKSIRFFLFTPKWALMILNICIFQDVFDDRHHVQSLQPSWTNDLVILIRKFFNKLNIKISSRTICPAYYEYCWKFVFGGLHL